MVRHSLYTYWEDRSEEQREPFQSKIDLICADLLVGHLERRFGLIRVHDYLSCFVI